MLRNPMIKPNRIDMEWHKVLDDASQIGEGQVMEANAGGADDCACRKTEN